MERFVRAITGGGIALVAGLWGLTLFDAWSPPWLLGVGVALLGLVGLVGGIWIEVDPSL